MSVIAAIGAGVVKGVGALARGVRNRKALKAGNAIAGASTVKTGFFSPAKRAARKEKRQIRKAAGGGFLKKAITRRRERKAAGLLPRQIRKARKQGAAAAAAGTAEPLTLLDTATGLPEYGEMAQYTGGEENQQAQKPSPVMQFIQDNWLIGVIIFGVIMLGKWLMSGNKRKK
jgi:hypothetical protein